MTEGETSLDWAIYKGDRAKIAVLEQSRRERGNGPRREEIPPPATGGIADPRALADPKRRAPARGRAEVPRTGDMHFLPSQRDAGAGGGDRQTQRDRDRQRPRAQESRRHPDVLQEQRAADDAGRSGGWRRSADHRLRADGAGRGQDIRSTGHRDDDALAAGAADAGRAVAWQRPQSSAVRIQRRSATRRSRPAG